MRDHRSGTRPVASAAAVLLRRSPASAHSSEHPGPSNPGLGSWGPQAMCTARMHPWIWNGCCRERHYPLCRDPQVCDEIRTARDTRSRTTDMLAEPAQSDGQNPHPGARAVNTLCSRCRADPRHPHPCGGARRAEGKGGKSRRQRDGSTSPGREGGTEEVQQPPAGRWDPADPGNDSDPQHLAQGLTHRRCSGQLCCVSE